MRALIVALVVLTALSFGPKPLGASTAVARSYTCQPQPYPPAAPLRLRGGAGKLTRAQKKLFQDLSQQEGIFSHEEPGEHEVRADKHVPQATLTDAGIDVVVLHPMDDKSDDKDLHYIEFIWIVDQDTGECLAAKNLFPGEDSEPKVSFKGNFANRCVTPYAMCNLHGTWRGQYVGTPKAPCEIGADEHQEGTNKAEAEGAEMGDTEAGEVAA